MGPYPVGWGVEDFYGVLSFFFVCIYVLRMFVCTPYVCMYSVCLYVLRMYVLRIYVCTYVCM